MSNIALNSAVRRENARALAAALGIDDLESAAQMLDVPVLVTAALDCPQAKALGEDVLQLLSRTLTHVSTSPDGHTYAVEVLIGMATPQSRAQLLQVSGKGETCEIGDPSAIQGHFHCVHPIFRRMTACYVAAVTLKVSLGDRLPFAVPTPLKLDFTSLGINMASLAEDINIGKAYLAGAGAIGNGLLWAAQGLRLRGELHVVDADVVDNGNLQRQIWFDEGDVGQAKCHQLVAKAQASYPHLHLVPREARLQELDDRNGGAWLKKLIVAVDSRRARRQLQAEAPGEVFDASTTDIREVVVHHHRQPTEDACLACIYHEDEAERSFESHIAVKLGVPVGKVRELVIDSEAAEIIGKRYSSIIGDPASIAGIPYDSLFKSLCGQGALSADDEHAEIVAPFAFVSALAGVMLALEIVRRHRSDARDEGFNFWRVSPWQTPQTRLRRQVPANDGCSFCSDATTKSVVHSLWRSEASS